MAGLLLLGLFVGFLILLPLMIVGLVLRLIFGIVLLPIRLAGFAIKVTFGLVAAAVGLVLGLIGLAVGLVAVGAVLLIPLLPFLALACGAWLLWRLARPKPAAPQPTF